MRMHSVLCLETETVEMHERPREQEHLKEWQGE